MRAGYSARAEAQRQRELAAAHESAARAALDRARRFSAAGRTELSTARTLAPLAALGYHQLADRAWPGSRRANIDLLLVGPSGVYVVDTKCWADVTVESGRLLRGQEAADDAVDSLLRLCDLVEGSVTEVGLAPLEVVPVLAFAGRRGVDERLGRVHLLGERDLLPFCARRGDRLSDTQVEQVLARLLADFPPYGSQPAVPLAAAVPPAPEVPAEPRSVQAPLEGLEDPAELQRAVVAAALAAPIEEWMTFLHPDQARLVRRSWSGPARIRGAAGTGKTVLGLHRTAYLTATRPGRVLYVSFVRTLPVVLGELYRAMSPLTADQPMSSKSRAWLRWCWAGGGGSPGAPPS